MKEKQVYARADDCRNCGELFISKPFMVTPFGTYWTQYCKKCSKERQKKMEKHIDKNSSTWKKLAKL